MNRKNVTRLLTDDDAVSPVIAVILMVAITVVLAAVIGTFVLGVGGKQSTAPQVSLSFEYDSAAGTVSVVHDGGSELDPATLSVKESGSSDDISVNAGGGVLSSSDVVASGNYESGETIKVVWRDPESKDSTVLAESKAPT